MPRIRYSTSIDDAMAKVAKAGLCGVRPRVNFPYYVVGTKPPAGTTVERGSRIEFLIGDG